MGYTNDKNVDDWGMVYDVYGIGLPTLNFWTQAIAWRHRCGITQVASQRPQSIHRGVEVSLLPRCEAPRETPWNLWRKGELCLKSVRWKLHEKMETQWISTRPSSSILIHFGGYMATEMACVNTSFLCNLYIYIYSTKHPIIPQSWGSGSRGRSCCTIWVELPDPLEFIPNIFTVVLSAKKYPLQESSAIFYQWYQPWYPSSFDGESYRINDGFPLVLVVKLKKVRLNPNRDEPGFLKPPKISRPTNALYAEVS